MTWNFISSINKLLHILATLYVSTLSSPPKSVQSLKKTTQKNSYG